MAHPASRLENLDSPYGRWETDEASGIGVYHVDNQHTFVQAAGYLKHVLGKHQKALVFYRGQSRLYPALCPTLYRGVTSQKVKANRDRALRCYLNQIEAKGKVLRAVRTYAREPLLQHYGIRTTWLDLVDNVWVALWFACHEPRCPKKAPRYVHFEPRGAFDQQSFCYVLMVASADSAADANDPSLFHGRDTQVIDLRIAAPSHFVRPHAQHAVLLKRSRGMDHEHLDYTPFVAGVLRTTLLDALSWLGRGDLVTIHSLFPPPTYDYGYRELLDDGPEGFSVGEIAHIGA